jgi:hypothetical protein
MLEGGWATCQHTLCRSVMSKGLHQWDRVAGVPCVHPDLVRDVKIAAKHHECILCCAVLS